ncbi:hypothetical protein LK459_11455 [Gordonia otitidis]|uniref:hypothetical protein n=1 Tax=Gordonia otitidis TaxID=249058 RepID=UPI001D14926A|nr:hypothetical protein [Gordonia otitidis]UEA61368.1 hypothetical protein LK459_11455 [Gordonia otitidis]
MSNLLHVLFAPEGASEVQACAIVWAMVVMIVASYSPRLAKRNLLNPNQYGDDE